MKAFLTCMGMFTKLPLPIVTWEENKGPAALCFLPFAGLICGGVSALLYFLMRKFGVFEPLLAAVVLISLFFICGFLHLDGFMDTMDSMLSARDREEKIRILKDSTVGAFSVISVCLLLLVLFASIWTLAVEKIHPLVFLFIPFASRALAPFLIFVFPPMANKGLFKYFRDGKSGVHTAVSVLFVCISAGVFSFISPIYTLICILSLLLVLLMTVKVKKELGGINGDIIGSAIIFTETFLYLGIAIAASVI